METTTKASGEYIFTPVRIGNYSLSVTAAGFATTTQENLHVDVAHHLQVNIQLKTGATTETVEVTTAPPLLQTEEGSVGQVINERTVNSLPLNGRNFTFLAQLGAGVNTPQADTRGNAASGAFTANGLRPSQNNYLLDGIDNNSDTVDFLNGTNFIVLPPVDAIQEFKVQTADFSADLGRCGWCCPQRYDQIRYKQHSRRGLGIFSKRQARRGGLVYQQQWNSQRERCASINSEPPSADRSSRTRCSISATTKGCESCRVRFSPLPFQP